MTEKRILTKIDKHKNIAKLCYAFQDKTSLYMVMELVKGGELLHSIQHFRDTRSTFMKTDMDNLTQQQQAFTLDETRYYTAVLVVSYLYFYDCFFLELFKILHNVFMYVFMCMYVCVCFIF